MDLPHGGMKMKKNLHIKINGFDIYMGISQNANRMQYELERAYQNKLTRESQERARFQQEYDLARLY